MFDYVVKDSSIWRDTASHAAYSKRDDSIRMGTVRGAHEAAKGEIIYMVETHYNGLSVPMMCSLMTRFGGFTNYEEYGLRSYLNDASSADPNVADHAYELRAGDVVLVACLQGNHREGVILGGIKHPARKAIIPLKEIAYISEFNGIETKISKTGAYRITNKALIPATLDAAVAGVPLFGPIYNPVVGGTYFEIGDDGSFTINDNIAQSIKVDKTGKKTIITSGLCTLTLEAAGNVSLDNIKTVISSKQKIEMSTFDFKVAATKSASLKATKVAIGNDSFELIDGLIKLIDALGALVVTSPNGPCNPLQGAPTWAQVLQIKIQLTALKGSL